jgi:hypothetical protein
MILETTNGHDKKVIEDFNKVAKNFDDYGLLEIILTNWVCDEDIKDITNLLKERLLT